MGKNIFNKLNNRISPEHITKVYRTVSKNILIPKFLVNLFRTPEQRAVRELNNLTKFDNFDILLGLLSERLIELKNSIFDIKKDIDRNSIRIEELENSKNNKISFLEYSDKFSNPDFNETGSQVLKHSIPVNTKQVEGFISNSDNGLELTETVIGEKSYIRINLDDSKIDGINFISSSSVKVKWNDKAQAYELLQNDIFQYDSEKPEKEIIINHNLGTRALDVKVFKFIPTDVELKYPIVPGIEYPSDNQVIIHLTCDELISVLISRI